MCHKNAHIKAAAVQKGEKRGVVAIILPVPPLLSPATQLVDVCFVCQLHLRRNKALRNRGFTLIVLNATNMIYLKLN